MNQDQVISISGLNTGYRHSKSVRLVSEAIDLSTQVGELVMLMGPNGSGKSTLMQTIAGLIRPLSGSVRIAGHDLGRIRDKERALLMSVVLTDRIEQGNLTVWDIVTTGRYPYLGQRGRLRPEDVRVLHESLELCSLSGMEHRYHSELSDGEKQRVMIARALAQETPLMLLDEPTAHLDLPSRLEVLTMLRRLARDLRKNILVSTHELDLALRWADVIWLFDRQGHISAGAPEDLILSERIGRVFGNDHLHFDLSTGEFRFTTLRRQPIRLVAQGLRQIWTQRALERMGYSLSEISDEATPLVEAAEDSWCLHIGGQEYKASSLLDLHKILMVHYPIAD